MAKKQILLIVSILIGFFAFVSGCSKRENPKKSQQRPSAIQDATARQVTEVKVPAEVKGKWKSVKIGIMDKENNKEGIVEIELGKTIKIKGTNLTVKAENFLPHFIMEGTTLTSSSNSPKNPAVQVQITDNNLIIFKGWLFTLYPNTHASQHPKYGFSLIDYTPNK